jgi:OHCU decarboxylase
MTLAEFNTLPAAKAEELLLDCCGCARWAAEMSARRPFDDVSAVLEAADGQWRTFEREDWIEAFSHHPQIGEKAATGSESHRRWSEGEQTGARVATEDVKARLAQGNRSYYNKFGYICMICATGKSAEEMLALLDQRLQNDPARELPIAAEQQRQISRLRLKKLFAGEPSS